MAMSSARAGPQLELFGAGLARSEPALPVRADERRIEELRASLSRRLGVSVRLSVHDNRSTMVSFRHERGTLALRVHHMFLAADEATATALADFASVRRRRRQAGRLLDAFIRRHQSVIRPPRPMERLQPRGRVHDLARVFDDLNRRHFDGTIDAVIGWSRAPLGRRRRTIKMGVYYHDTRTIRIHPALDHPSVPAYVIEFIVFHEMLHQACPTETAVDGKKLVHTKRFRARERAHPDHDRALAWEKEHLGQLLARRS
jgi:hypothetical protein